MRMIDAGSIGGEGGRGMVNKRKAPARRSAGAGRKRVAFEDLTVGDIVNKPIQATRPDMKGDRVVVPALSAGRHAGGSDRPTVER